MANLSDVKRYLSGGGSNTSPAASLGGAISSSRILNQTVTRASSLITGVTIDDAFGNPLGTGTLSFSAATKTITWTPPTASIGTAVDISVSGSYSIQGASNGGAVAITVVASSLPSSNVSDSVIITARANALWDDVTKQQSNDGRVEYRCEYLKNTHATDSMVDFNVWIAANAVGQDSVAIGLDPAGIAGTAVTIANETTAPVGVTFSSPTSGSPLAVGTLDAGEYQAVWIRRTVPAGVTVATPADGYQLGISCKV